MSRKRVTSRKASTTLIARVRSLSGMQLGVALEVVQATEARLASLTHIRLLLTVGQQVAFEIVVSRKVRGAIWTFVSLV